MELTLDSKHPVVAHYKDLNLYLESKGFEIGNDDRPIHCEEKRRLEGERVIVEYTYKQD